MSSCGLEETRVRQAALEIAGAGQPHDAEDLNFTPRVERLITKALTEAESLGRSQIEPKHLLIAILREDAGIATRILERTEVRSTALLKALLAQ
jgi:ATP-dependent Clp protease ATP-binding subunit ClpC